jgi:hypothetical protein
VLKAVWIDFRFVVERLINGADLMNALACNFQYRVAIIETIFMQNPCYNCAGQASDMKEHRTHSLVSSPKFDMMVPIAFQLVESITEAPTEYEISM